MKKFFYLFLLPLLLLNSCSSSSDGYEGPEQKDPVVLLVSNVDEILNDGTEAAIFTVTADGVNVTSEATIYDIATDDLVENAAFTSETVGFYEFRAKYRNILSEVCTVEVKSATPGEVPAPSTKNTLLVYLAIDNDFSVLTDYTRKVEAMRKAFEADTDGNLLVYCDQGNGQPVLVHIYQDTMGENKADTIVNYNEPHNSADPQLLRSLLLEVREKFPAEKYGMILLSHASGWLPKGTLGAPRSVVVDWNEKNSNSDHNEMEIPDLAEAIPYELEYMIFDACLMGGIEVVYELKDKVKYIVSSPAEVLVPGFVYSTMPTNLLKAEPDVVAVASDFYNYYNSLGGDSRSATVSVVETAKLDAVAEISKRILEDVDGEPVVSMDIQRYYPAYRIYFDFGHYIYFLDTELYDEFMETLAASMVYKASTPSYYSSSTGRSSPIDVFSGLSIYIPQVRFPYMNSEYAKTKWAQDVNPFIPIAEE